MNFSAEHILKELIRCESTSEKGELQCALKIKEIFNSLGVDCEVDCFDDSRANVTAKIGSLNKPLLVASHLDVVPADETYWDTNPFEPVVKGGKLYGRGSADMKGGMAVVISAIAELLAKGKKFERGIIFSATAGEEVNSCGAFRFLDKNQELQGNLSGVIVPEPTGMQPMIGHKGILWLKISFKGKPAHGSMPHLGVNAVENAFKFHSKVIELGFEKIKHPILGNCTVSCNKINGGNAVNIIPDQCDAYYDVRMVKGITEKDIVAKFENIIKILNSTEPNFDASVKIHRQCPWLFTQPEDRFVIELCKTVGKDWGVVSYTTDSPYFARLAAPVVVVGPGEASMCHKINENINLTDLEQAHRSYVKILSNLG